MFANALARISAALLTKALTMRSKRIVITRPWSGGLQVIFDGDFDGVEFERVHDSRGFVFYVKAKPKALKNSLMQWATPATRPHLIPHTELDWSEEFKAWAKHEV